MRQIVSLVQDGRVQYAITDDSSDELIEFAQILVPERFTLAQAAHLGVNLADAIGLNGAKRRIGPPPAVAVEPERTPPALGSGTGKETRKPCPHCGEPITTSNLPRHIERQHPVNDQLRADGRPRKRKRPNPKHPVKRYISGDEVLAVIAQHPEGITVPGIARVISDDEGDYPWVRISVANRFAAWRDTHRKTGAALPYREGKHRDHDLGRVVPMYRPL